MASHSIRTTLLGLFVLVAAIPILLLATVGVVWLQPKMEDEVTLRHHEIAHAIAAQIQLHLLSAKLQVEGTASLLASLQQLDSIEASNTLHAAIQPQNSMVSALYLISPAGRIERAALKSENHPDVTGLINLDLSHNRVFQDVARTGKETWSDTFLSVVSGQLTVAFAMPCDSHVVVAEVDLNGLSRYLEEVLEQHNLLALVLDSRGQVIADAQNRYTAQQLNIQNLPIVSEALRTGDSQTRLFEFEGKRMVGNTITMPILRWNTLVAEPVSSAYGSLYITTAVAGFSLLLAVVLAVVVAASAAQRMAARFGILTAYVRNLATGTLVPSPSFPVTEFETLATDMYQTASALHERNESYRLLFERSNDAIFLVRRSDGRYLDANEAAARLTSRSVAEIKTLSTADVSPKGAPARLELLKASQDNTDFQEVEYLRPDGEIRIAQLSVVPLNDEVCYGIARDITERKHDEDALRRSEEKYRLLAESTESILWEFDLLQNRWTYVAPQALRILGYAPEEWTDRNFLLSCIHPQDLDAIVSHTGLETSHIVEFRFIKKNGEIAWLRNFVSVELHDGVAVKERGFLHDITRSRLMEAEKKALQDQLTQAQKMESVGRLAGGVAHDFNNMLSVILGYAEIAMNDASDDPALCDKLKEILKAAEHSAALTRQLLAFARKQEAIPEVLDLNVTTASMLKILKRLIGEDIALHFRPEASLWPVKMDPSQVDQILANLLVNARDAIDGVGAITIETGNVLLDRTAVTNEFAPTPGEYVLLSVSDTGIGMDKATAMRIFEPFFTTKEVGKGTGLGLATVYGIVKQNEGSINVYSEPGQGTTFKIYLPRLRDHAEESPKGAPARPLASGSETILLVEDEEPILRMTQIILDELGYRVFAASSPQEALQIARNYGSDIDLLLTDVVMPGMNGRELSSQITTLNPRIKCLYVSGYTAEVIAQRGILAPSIQLLQKPFTARNLAAKIRKVLDH